MARVKQGRRRDPPPTRPLGPVARRTLPGAALVVRDPIPLRPGPRRTSTTLTFRRRAQRDSDQKKPGIAGPSAPSSQWQQQQQSGGVKKRKRYHESEVAGIIKHPESSQPAFHQCLFSLVKVAEATPQQETPRLFTREQLNCALEMALNEHRRVIAQSVRPSHCIKCHKNIATVIYEHQGGKSLCMIHCENCPQTSVGSPCLSCGESITAIHHTGHTTTKCQSCFECYPNAQIMHICGDACTHLACIGCVTKAARFALNDKIGLMNRGGVRCLCHSSPHEGGGCTAVMSAASITQLFNIWQMRNGSIVRKQACKNDTKVVHPGERPKKPAEMSQAQYFRVVQDYNKRSAAWKGSQTLPPEIIPMLTKEEKTKLEEWSQDALIPADCRMDCIRQEKYRVKNLAGDHSLQMCQRSFNAGRVEPFGGYRVECPYCRKAACRWCKKEWHDGKTCVEAAIQSELEKQDETKRLIRITAKRCPKCDEPATKYHGHGCHHIIPGNGCAGCGHHWCYACRGKFRSCGCLYQGSTFCPTGNTKKEFLKHVTSSNGWPCDDRCGCLFCPDCRKGEPCSSCGGSCPVCRGWVPPGKLPGGESKTTKTREKLTIVLDMMKAHPKSIHVLKGCMAELRTYYTLPPAVRPCLDKAVEHGLDKIDSVGRLMWKLYGKVTLHEQLEPLRKKIKAIKRKYQNSKEWTLPFLAAAASGRHEDVDMLLKEHEMDVNQAESGCTALFLASSLGHVDVVKLLLAQPSIEVNVLVHSKSLFGEAAENGHKHVNELLWNHPSIDTNMGLEGMSPLCVASLKGHIGIVRLLLSLDCVDVDTLPLFAAISEGHTKIAELLMNHPSINLNETRLSREETPLHAAINAANTTIIKLLLANESVDANLGDKDWNKPLHNAIHKGQTEVLELLLSNKTVYANVSNSDGNTPLYFAVHAHNFNAVKSLLDVGCINVNARNDTGCTPLHRAVEEKDIGIVQLLLANPLIDVNVIGAFGKTPLYRTIEGECESNVRIMDMLLNHESIDVNVKNEDKSQESPLILASRTGKVNTAKKLMAHQPPANVNATSIDNETALCFAAQNGHVDLVNLILRSPGFIGDVNFQSGSGGFTPLMRAISYEHIDVANILMGHHSMNVNVSNSEGETPLQMAACLGDPNLVKDILSHPSFDGHVDVTDIYECTPRFEAERRGHTNIVSLLAGVDKHPFPNWDVLTNEAVTASDNTFELMDVLEGHEDGSNDELTFW